MKQRDVRAFLWDIDHACQVLTRAATERTFEDYTSDVFLRFAVERAFEIIGEALRNIAVDDPELAARISDVPENIAFRNNMRMSIGVSYRSSCGVQS